MSDLEVSPLGKTATATFNNVVIAKSDKALVVKEGAYSPVIYFPKSDIQMGLLSDTDKSSVCPKKGTARYWSINHEGKSAENAAWAYDEPTKDAALPLKDHIAFYNFVVKVDA